MKKITLLVALSITIFGFSQNDEDARKILNEVSNKMKSYDTLYVEFSSSLDNDEQDVHQITKGNASLKGDLFLVNLLGITTIFDGKHVYSINQEDEEVNISDKDENEFTPAQFFSFYEEGYAFEMTEMTSKNDQKLQFIKLIPIDNNSEFNYVLLGVDTKTMHIKTIIQKGKNGTDYTLKITNFKTNVDLSNKLFTFNKKEYEEKGYIINEL